MKFSLEICVDSIQSAMNAQMAGADRIELCSSLPEGGTTPSYGMIVEVREKLKIGIHVLIRPRGGDFLYSENEFEIMKKDIGNCRTLGVDGIVTGILNKDGSVDVRRTRELVVFAHPLSVTFHRAFDMCADPLKSLEDIIGTGANRLLTSGQKNKAPDGIELIKDLTRRAGSRMIIMPGGGISDVNIESIAKLSGASEFHLTGRKVIESKMIYRKSGVSMGSFPDIEFSEKIADPEIITRIKNILTGI